jgi:hypothetical protein
MHVFERARGFHQKFNNPLPSSIRGVDEGWMTATRASRQPNGSRSPTWVGGMVLIAVGALILGVDAILLLLTVAVSGFDPGAGRMHHWFGCFAWALIGLLCVGLGVVRSRGCQPVDADVQPAPPTVAWNLTAFLLCLLVAALGLSTRPVVVLGVAVLASGLGIAFIDSRRGHATRVTAAVLAASGLAVVAIRVLGLYMA